jgi:hypothetical protein
MGVLILADLTVRAQTFSYYYTEDGVVPRWLGMLMSPEGAFSLFFLSTDSRVTAALFVLHALVAIQLILGYKTSLATIVSFLFVISLDHRNTMVVSHADVIFRLLLFWGIFLPLGERWSIDALQTERPPRRTIANLASLAILSQMLYMYIANWYQKTLGTDWPSGQATPLIFGLDDITYFLGDFMRNFETALYYGGFAWFYMLMLAWLLLVLPWHLRTLAVGAFFVAHLSFALTVRIGAFPFAAIAGVILFLQAPFWDVLYAVTERFGLTAERRARLVDGVRGSMSRIADRLPAYSVQTLVPDTVSSTIRDTALIVSVLVVLAIPAASAATIVGSIPIDVQELHRVTSRYAAMIAVRQPPWTVFAPRPRTVDRYYVIAAQTADGEVLDIYNDRPLTFERPYRQLNRQYSTYRERFYMNSVSRGGRAGAVPQRFSEYLCEHWANERGVELAQINIYVISETVTRATINNPENRQRGSTLAHMYGCDGAQGQRIPVEEIETPP